MTRIPYTRGLWQRGRNLFTKGFFFDRPLLLIQSDDWGRVGLRDQEGFEELRSAGVLLGENPYDLYTLETSEDVADLRTVLSKHRDSAGRSAVMAMYFVVANVDFSVARQSNYKEIPLRLLSKSLPGRWWRPGLLDSYRGGIQEGTIYPALHGTTHFCRPAVRRELVAEGKRGDLLRTLWRAETPYIFWRMPWIGYEYWDPAGKREERHLPIELQSAAIGEAVEGFSGLFGRKPFSACAPGYRANASTHCAWKRAGIKVAQNGPDKIVAPSFDRYGILNLCRNINFEPALDRHFSVERCLRTASECFARGVPAVLSTHSINFHSTVKDFRSTTLRFLNEFLDELTKRHPNLLYVHEEDLYQLIGQGVCRRADCAVKVGVRQKNIHLARIRAA